MTRITRTIKVRGSKRMTGILFFLIAISFLIIGWLKHASVLIWSAITIFLLLLFFTIARRQTVVTLDAQGILYKSLFWDLRLPWREVKSCGVYFLQERNVHIECPKTISKHPVSHPVHYIFVSLRPGYAPQKQDRFIGRTSIHFRWHPDAWEVISKHVDPSSIKGLS